MALAPRSTCVVTMRAELGSSALPLSQVAGAPSYLSGPIAMNQDREGVIGQVPRSHVAHFKLEYNLIWGPENTVPSSIRPEAKLRDREAGLKSQLPPREQGVPLG